MAEFNLKIVTPNGLHFEGPAEALTVRTVTGDVSIWANHVNLVTALATGKAFVTVNGDKRPAACSGGVLSVIKNEVTVLASTFEWKEDIDLERAKSDLEKAKEDLKNARTIKQKELEKVRIRRAITRIEVKEM